VAFLKKSSVYLVLAGMLLFIIAANYQRGLFFDTDLYGIELFIGMIFFIYLLLQYDKWETFLTQPYIWFLAVIPLLYFLMVFFAENQLLAFQQFLRWVMATQLFILAFMLKEQKWGKEIIWFAILVMGVWTSIFGWLGAYQLVDFKDAYLVYRIASVFQYPNTFAAILSAILIGVLIRSTEQDWKYALTAFSSYLLFITFIFTYSRGGWLVFALIWVIALFFLSFRQQILYIAHSIFIGLAAILTLSPLTDSLAEQTYVSGLRDIVLSALAVGIVYTLIHVGFYKIRGTDKLNPWIRWVIPVGFVIMAIVSSTSITNSQVIEKLPDILQKRVADIHMETKSVVERTNFYQDATKMITDHPLFGSGGGAWRQQFERYQSYPYTSRQAHNFYYQMAVEVGIIGLTAFLAFLFFILFSMVKSRKTLKDQGYIYFLSVAFFVVLLLTHSFIDFNMSYGYFHGLVMVLLGMIAQPLSWQVKKQKMIKTGLITYMLLLTFIGMVYSGRFYYAEKAVGNLVQVNIQEADTRLKKAIALNPYETTYRFYTIDLYQKIYQATKKDSYKQVILKELQRIEDTKQVDSTTMLKTASVYANMGYLGNALDLIKTAKENGPWRIQLYDQEVVYAFHLARHYKQHGDQQKYSEMIALIYNDYEEVLKKREYLDQQIPVLQYREFRPSETMRLFVGKTYLVEEAYEQGFKLLLPLTKSKKETTKREAIAWAVYGYQKAGNNKKAEEYLQLGKELGVAEEINSIYEQWK